MPIYAKHHDATRKAIRITADLGSRRLSVEGDTAR